MIINSEDAKRLAVFFFYDKRGIVDRYVPYLLDDLRKNVTEICTVCNGEIPEKSMEILGRYGDVFVRENKGFDVWAYKEAMARYGWDRLQEFDEVILLNNTIMGPVYPFRETFEKMDRTDVDFWGLTECFRIKKDPFGYSPYGYIPDHIQSHWIACRRSLVSSKVFQDYWDKIPAIEDYAQAIGKHESLFTKRFADMGFKWKVSVECEDLRDYSGYPLLMCPKRLLQERRCPIFKKRSFFHMESDFLCNTMGEQTTELYEFLKNETNYDVDFIWETILRSYPQYDIVKNMNLTYILSKEVYDNEMLQRNLKANKVALVMHLYFPDLLEESYRYVSSMPEEADIYLTTDTVEKKAAIEQTFAAFHCHKLEVRLIKNRGRDVSSLLVGVKDVIMQYDIVCFAHDKKSAQIIPGTVGASFAYKCFENTLSGKAFVANVIQTFAEHPRMGILSPPSPNHGTFIANIGNEWGPNYELTKSLADRLGLTVPIERETPPVAPYGTMFWFRPKAMKRLFDMDWKYEDFPEEPNGVDGTLLHAVERIYPYVVQESGYYPAIVMNDRCASIEYTNLHFYVREHNKRYFSTSFKYRVKRISKKYLSENAYKKLKKCWQWVQEKRSRG